MSTAAVWAAEEWFVFRKVLFYTLNPPHYHSWIPLDPANVFICVSPLSGSALRVATADTTATPTSPVLWTQRTSGGCSTTAGTSSRECTYGSTNSCDGRRPSSAFCVFSFGFFSPSVCILEEPFLFLLLLLPPHKQTPRPPLLSRTMKYYWSVSNPPLLNLLAFCTSFFLSQTNSSPCHRREMKVGEQSCRVPLIFKIFFFLFLPFWMPWFLSFH